VQPRTGAEVEGALTGASGGHLFEDVLRTDVRANCRFCRGNLGCRRAS